ncbi:hypothetical protein HH214_08790 [Mucilaginibacter robiniae]|uniref:Peptidase domain-containing ABC transporter n=1 Tax=Mucilaginibacter robiniae TaxID=2728022 RepID=A0A7L5DY75_9SPHI|nr:cysteine peptidase family C39 domain-containing protein [Mucilaginibacter robiniae]QJD95965.1 hypothetical protein HH214_08790 [Mucilaginibacter robiniae]
MPEFLSALILRFCPTFYPMQYLSFIKQFFVRQSGEDDCGIACLSMILNYAGLGPRLALLPAGSCPPGSLSLLQLRDLARQTGLDARCVEMEVSFLRTITAPVILHLSAESGESHYQVCYGSRQTWRGRVYLMADPARQVHELPEAELSRLWSSHAALYLEKLPQPHRKLTLMRWAALLKLGHYPAGLMVSIPLLSLGTALFGAGLSWVLQQGLNDPSLLQGRVLGALLFLLLLMSVFKSLVTVLRQYILTQITLRISQRLMSRFLSAVFAPTGMPLSAPDRVTVKYQLLDMQKIQQAISAFMAVLLSDGMMILLLLGGICYWIPGAGFLNALYLLLISSVYYRRLTAAVYASARLSHLGGYAEDRLVRDVLRLEAIRRADLSELRKSVHQTNHERVLADLKNTALGFSKLVLLTEFFGALDVVGVLALSVRYMQHQQCSYSTLMLTVIFTYLITALAPRVGQSLQAVTEGIDAAVQYDAKHPPVPSPD